MYLGMVQGSTNPPAPFSRGIPVINSCSFDSIGGLFNFCSISNILNPAKFYLTFVLTPSLC